ncbi:MAG TPA: DUF5723 family protein [Bacteroidia bacterium]|nr:DUF5723 family protein [Bacteroidia bacterium]HNU32100.1 DUF5723 family protein [Bacteroidia bacterium]
MKIKLLITFLAATITASAQQNMVMYQMGTLPQQQALNPAFMPEQKFSFGIPFLSSIDLGYYSTGFKYNDLVRHSVDDSLYMDFENMLDKLADENNIGLNFETQLLAAQYRFGKNYFGFAATEKLNLDFRYNKILIDFVLHGNGAFLGEEIHPSFALNMNHYREYAFGFGRKFTDKLSIGTRFKYLSGLQNVQTKAADFTLATNSESFEITGSPNLAINSGGFGEDITQTMSFNDYMFTKGNKGFAMDFGADYQVNDKLSFSFSLLDVGYINWKSDVTNYIIGDGGNFTYNGIDLNHYIQDSTDIDESFQNFLDSLTGTLNLDTLHEAYKAWLPTKLYMSADLKIAKNSSASFLIYNRFQQRAMRPAIAVSFTQKVGKWFEASVNYSLINKHANNFGLGIALRGSGVQYFIMSDNAIGVFLPHKVNTFNFKMGMNLVFGN